MISGASRRLSGLLQTFVVEELRIFFIGPFDTETIIPFN
jgi:hypothetical protein